MRARPLEMSNLVFFRWFAFEYEGRYYKGSQRHAADAFSDSGRVSGAVARKRRFIRAS
jgi:hypothetical protein